MKDRYVILTGSKNNAGDFLIKHRAKKLFKEFRPDREIVDLDRWVPFDEETLAMVNDSRALILTGGPALHPNMYPNLYKMSRLSDIKVPIITMGIGWSSKSGEWSDTYTYGLSDTTKELFERIENSGYLSSVRDYHSLNVLHSENYKNFLMTGCPAYYSTQHIGKDFEPYPIKKVSFSVGVAFNHSRSMEKLLKESILQCKEYFADETFEVIFHHSLDATKRNQGVSGSLFDSQKEFETWLLEQKITYKDISGSAENLIEHYSTVDLHIGYRVHAHIFMNSISRYSILLNEDGRGKSIKNVIGGITIDAFDNYEDNLLAKKLNQLINYDRYRANTHLPKQLISELDYEKLADFNRFKLSRKNIDSNFKIMQRFLAQLP
ncbi:polysaccharide pyruvyl transferase family protein [Sulfurimonas sp. HSL3-7]|uniref:polysaccharide pyruvyl transferase family protein n=1 Tax=Sulfonitrofixus jiaomeiensis TaxID=3131938 RepID=UPI0031FA0C02